MRFQDIIGHKALKESLVQIVRDDHLSHALLFAGPEGSGNLALALGLSGYLLCKNRTEHDRCGVCPDCKQLDKLTHPDLHFSFPFLLKDKIKNSDTFQKNFQEELLKNPYLSLKDWELVIAGENKQSIIPVGESQEIIRKLSLKAFGGGYKVMILWMPEKLRSEAANKLLKTLEEPSPKTIIMLVSSKPDDLLATIISRTQRVKCRPLTDKEIIEGLTSNYGFERGISERAARMAEGNINHALKIVNEPDAESAYFVLFRDWMRACVAPGKHDMTEVTEKIASLSRDQQGYFLDYCLSFMHEAMMYAYLGSENSRFTGDSLEFANKFAPFIVGKDLGDFHDVLSKGAGLVSRNVNPRLLYMKMSAEMIRVFKGKRPEPIS